MGAITLGSSRRSTKQHHHHSPKDHHHHAAVAEEIEGLIRVYRDGRVERLPVVKDVPCTLSPDPAVASADVPIHASTRLWARLYAPFNRHHHGKLPVLLYFHGGGFCVGSASWACYHEFLYRLSSAAGCAIVSVNYRLAPEHRLPAAYEDGLRALRWVLSHRLRCQWWSPRCNFARVFLAGDSAGGAIAYHVALQMGAALKGVVLIQPFFGGEARTASERGLQQLEGSALTLAASDAYWRMALPAGTRRDHPWCNPVAAGARERMEEARLPRAMVCVAETDILRDRDVEVCRAMRRAGKEVEVVVHGGVGHAFHVLGGGSRLAQGRTQEMMAQIRSFVGRAE